MKAESSENLATDWRFQMCEHLTLLFRRARWLTAVVDFFELPSLGFHAELLLRDGNTTTLILVKVLSEPYPRSVQAACEAFGRWRLDVGRIPPRRTPKNLPRLSAPLTHFFEMSSALSEAADAGMLPRPLIDPLSGGMAGDAAFVARMEARRELRRRRPTMVSGEEKGESATPAKRPLGAPRPPDGRARQLLLLADTFSERAAEAARTGGAWMLDGAGNIYINRPGFYLERCGRKSSATSRAVKVAPNVFRGKSGIVVRTLLETGGKPWMTETLASAAGASFGLISRITTQLVEWRMAERTTDGLRVTKPAALLDRLAKDYDQQLVDTVRIKSSQRPEKILSVLLADSRKKKSPLAVTDLGRAHPILQGRYVAHTTCELEPLLQEQGLETDPEGMIWLRRTRDAAVYGSGKTVILPEVGRVRLVQSDVQLFLDLQTGGADEGHVAAAIAHRLTEQFTPVTEVGELAVPVAPILEQRSPGSGALGSAPT